MIALPFIVLGVIIIAVIFFMVRNAEEATEDKPIRCVIATPSNRPCTPKYGDYRIIELKKGGFVPQIYGKFSIFPEQWLSIGSVGTKEVTHWAYYSDELILKSEEECREKIKQYEIDQADKYGKDSAIKQVIPL